MVQVSHAAIKAVASEQSLRATRGVECRAELPELRGEWAASFGDDAVGPFDEADEDFGIAELEAPLRDVGFGDAARSGVHSASAIMREAGEDLRGVVGIGAAVPELERADDEIFVERDSLPL